MLSTCSRAHVEEGLGHLRDQLALADARLESLTDELIGAVDHRAGHVQQHDLVGGFHLAGVEHRLLAVMDGDVLGFQRSEHRWLDEVDAERHSGNSLGAQDLRDLPGSSGEQTGLGRHGASQPDHPAADVLRWQPWAVEPVVLRGGSEVPEVRLAAAGQEGEARHLVAGPLPDVGARDVADVVEVEDQEGAEVRCLERIADALEPVVPQPLGVHTLLPVDGLRSRGGDRSSTFGGPSSACAVVLQS